MNIPLTCRSCQAPHGRLILDLGAQPLANNLLRPDDLEKPEPKFPLRLFVCPHCWLLQIADDVPPVQLFTEYLYFSSFSETMLRHARQAALRYIADFALGADSLVIEIASNDGYLLKNFAEQRVPCLGIEPAANIAKAAREQGVETLVEFFGRTLAGTLKERGGAADLVLGNNVFAHAPNTNDFVAGLATVLKPQGRIVLEFPYAVDFLDHREFDTIYHEHVFYFTLTALQPLFERHGLAIHRVERLPIHGGSLRLFAARRGDYLIESSVANTLAAETTRGISEIDCYLNFAQRVHSLKQELNSLVQQLKGLGKTVAAYGASAKGSTLLNFFGLGKEQIQFIVDRSTYKQGRLSPGMHIPILPPEQLLARRPDYTLLLTWNFAEEILQQQAAYRAAGGKFIIPIPEVTVV
jgi:SAM-dependent methyltransferase